MSDSIKLKPVFKNTIFMGGGDYQQGFEDGKSAGFAEGEAFGKQNAPTENLDITITSNGSYSYPKPNDKYYADVEVVVNVPSEKTPTQEKSKTITKNGTEVISPDDGYALSKVTVVTQIPERLPTQTKTIDIDENGTEEVTADSGYALEKVIINTDIDTRLPEQEKSLEVTENKVYEVVPDSGFALKKVTVTGNVASAGGGDDGQAFKVVTLPPEEWDNEVIATNTSFRYNIRSVECLKPFQIKKAREMFGGFYNLQECKLSKLDTSLVANMGSMFSNCKVLTSLDLSSFDTSSVTDMSLMFFTCNELTSLDLSSFDTSSVTSIAQMFNNCKSLTSLDLSSFNTSKVTNMSGLFNGCKNLQSLDLSSFDTSSVTDIAQIFTSCSQLTDVIFGNNWMNNKSVTTFDIYKSPLSKASILDLANKIADKSDKSVYTSTYKVTLKSSQKSLFTEDELTALANQFTAKNWTLAWS